MAPPLRGLTPLLRLAAVLALGLVFTLFILLLAGAPPFQTLFILFQGGMGSATKLAQTLAVFAPLALCSSALLFTFAAGLWNIGIEGQVVLGAVCATGLLRYGQGGGGTAIALGLAAGMAGGALWAALAGGLKAWGRVHEIFSGLGLNFVALGLTLWLIFGPWKRPGVASMSGTTPFDESLWLPELFGLPVGPVSLILAVAGLVAVALILGRTYWGLSLKAVGQNREASTMLGLKPDRRVIEAMAACGALAGLAGALQVAAVYHRLIPAISSNYGYTGLLVVMMASYRPRLVPFICLFFACLNVGSIQLPLQLQIDSSLSGVLQGALVLSVFTVQGLEQALVKRSRA
ncbi:MAG: ABC transporter permease [Thermodesulfobacteriota bacterium]